MGKYVITKSEKNGKYHFNLVSKEPILTSQQYMARKGALKGIRSVTKNAPKAPVEDQTVKGFKKEGNPKFELYQGKDKKFYFRLVAANGQPIGRSEGYNSKPACKNGIKAVKANAKSAIEKPAKKAVAKKAPAKKAPAKKVAKKVTKKVAKKPVKKTVKKVAKKTCKRK